MWSKYCEARLLARLCNSSIATKHNHLSILLAVILSSIVLALAGPSWQKQDHAVLESSAARVLILDLSQSMLVEDVKPNRFERARQIMRRILNSNFDGETALVVFSASAFTVSPLTRDATTLLEFIKALSPQTMPLEGNRLDLALKKANRLLTASITRSGQIIVITDGISRASLAKHQADESRLAGNNLSIIAVGSLQGGPLKSDDGSLKRNSNGEYILAKPNLQQLKNISRLGNGKFLHLTHSAIEIESLVDASNSSKDLKTFDNESESLRLPENAGYWLVWLILPLSLLLFRKNTIWLLLITIFAPADQKLYAMDWNEFWLNDEQRAFQAYQQGDYELVEELSNKPSLIGRAYYRQQNFAGADKVFSLQNTVDSLYNRGNTLAQLGQLSQALIAYQQALKLEPAFARAQFNHDLIKRFLDKNPEADSESSGESDGSAVPEDQQEEFSGQSRQGQVNEITDFRDQSEQTGIGASPSLSQSDLIEEENVSEAEIQLEQFLRQIQQEDIRLDPEAVKLWTENLYTDPSELFKRKFLRDHLRNKRQQR